MIRAHSSILIDCPVEQVFQYTFTDFFENYPKWSPEVTELEKITNGPVRKGTLAKQVRVDKGHRTESIFQVTEYEPLRRACFESTSNPYYRALYDFESIKEATTRFQFTFELQLELLLLPFEVTISRSVEAGSEKVVHNLKRLLEAENRPPLATRSIT